MRIVKTVSILALTLVGACQASTSSVSPITVINAPASDHAERLDLMKLPKGFPMINEMELAAKPAGCGLSKANRLTSVDKPDDQNYDARYVFALQDNQDNDAAVSEPLYNVGITGVLRTFKQTSIADMGAKKVRYFKTVDGPEVEIMVVIEPSKNEAGENVTSSKGILGRIKAWDAGVPLMCAYNRIEVVGDCDL